jgi:23S rRNA (cytidine2498-2'-O)-methyltransferase
MDNLNDTTAIYITKPEFISQLTEELGEIDTVIETLIFSKHKKINCCFALDVWLNPNIITFQSISEAVNILRQAGKFWVLYPLTHIRRSRLIEGQLPKYKTLISSFPLQDEIPSIGGFTLLNKNTLVYSTKRLKKWPHGACFFIEDKHNPPNRAYLKLWEALTIFNKYPKLGELALDLGASPGGWTYVLQSLGAQVTAVDKAPLAPNIASLPLVHYLQQSAFALDPATLNQPYDWVLSDIACYPERAYALIMKWMQSGKAKNIIVTIKLQGKTDLTILTALKAIPNSRLLNLFYNKHEATFFYPVYDSLND